MEELFALGAVFWLFVFLLAILWCILPFAIFGIKPLLREIKGELHRSSQQLTALTGALNNNIEILARIEESQREGNQKLSLMGRLVSQEPKTE